MFDVNIHRESPLRRQPRGFPFPLRRIFDSRVAYRISHERPVAARDRTHIPVLALRYFNRSEPNCLVCCYTIYLMSRVRKKESSCGYIRRNNIERRMCARASMRAAPGGPPSRQSPCLKQPEYHKKVSNTSLRLDSHSVKHMQSIYPGQLSLVSDTHAL